MNLSNEQLLAGETRQAYRFFQRLRGLMFTGQLNSGAGLHIKPCRSIHTFFMNYPIDVVYVNELNVVIAIDESMEPGKLGKVYADAASVVELPVGTVKKTMTKQGHSLDFVNN
ncbi:DUF192 domain-containing protein [Thalassobacillus hwangdonensis]|uniref:DUF192 domain-containing protein n=1 Tax=Thalassobacillus hwangdonensis TaxID=546108 RepID=A0ABW3L1I3_9BACI